MNRILYILFAAVFAVGAAIFWSSMRTDGTGVQLGAVSAQEAQNIDTSAVLEMTLGDANAPVTVVEYASFTCPHCQRFHAGPFKQLKSEYIDTGKVHFIYREVYFDRFGLWAGMVARCAGPEKYFGISDILYDEQKEWIGSGDPATIAANLRKIGVRAGMDEDQVNACLQDRDMAQAMVALYQKNAAEDGINSTPTFVINGETHSNMPYDEFKAILDAAIGG